MNQAANHNFYFPLNTKERLDTSLKRVVGLVVSVFVLSGCAFLGEKEEVAEEDFLSPLSANAKAFNFVVKSNNSDIAKMLQKDMSLHRYMYFQGLQQREFERIKEGAYTNAYELLVAQGYANPKVTINVVEVKKSGATLPSIEVNVETGPQTRVTSSSVMYAEPMRSDSHAQKQREHIGRVWPLKAGQPFTQKSWSEAKNLGLRTLQRESYPTAKIAESKAIIHADNDQATIKVVYDPGVRYKFGDIKFEGQERYDPQGIKNIAQLPTGEDYSEERMLDAQQRLSSSGYFDSVFLMLDTEKSDPAHATVIAQLREAKYQKMVFGVGVSTDAGFRLSMDHTHNKMWPLGWRAVNRIELDSKKQNVETQWTAMPRQSGWATNLGANINNFKVGDIKAHSLSLRTGQSKEREHIDRKYYLQYDVARERYPNGPSRSASSLHANYSWTGRYFDNKTNPQEGYGLSAELGGGFTITPQQEPFLRMRMRGLYFMPIGSRNEQGRRARLALRAEMAGIVAKQDVAIPANLLFLTGGDTTVRGYNYESIGVRRSDGSLFGGLYMNVASVEWQRPISVYGNDKDWEHVVFLDAGSVSDKLGKVNFHTGVGTGMRWNSPIGPLQIDIAYGLKGKRFRFHLRMGFVF